MDIIENLTSYACEDLDHLPAYFGCNTVRIRRGGTRLARIFWCGAQWAATSYGVEARDGSFRIPVSRIWEHEETNGWVSYMSGDEEIDLQDFCEALRLARAVHAGRLDPRALRPRFAAAG